MKKLILFIIAFIILIVGFLWISFVWYEPNIKSLFSGKPTIKEWKYKGHDMILYEYKNSYSICHSPVCEKCYQIYD